MKKRFLILAVLGFFSHSLNVFAINAPLVGTIPSEVEGNTYILTIYTEEGATVSVVGGPSQLAPVTDGAGFDPKDGQVQVQVPLIRNTNNSFSITAQSGTDISDAVMITIKEVSALSSGSHPIPEAPVLNDIPVYVDASQYIISGTAGPNLNIYVRDTEGKVVGSTQAGPKGKFQVTVQLQTEATNRFNVSAENEDGEEGRATQAVIRQTVRWEGGPESEEPALATSSQIFFNDIQGHWAEQYINQLYEADVVSGKSDGIFDPNGLITRAELTKIAILAFGHSVNPTPGEHPFQDVPLNSWYAPYVEEAKRLGFVSGYDTGGFGPNDYVTRAAALKILLGAAGLNPVGNVPDFPDVPTDAWYANYVGFAQKIEIVGGYQNGTFGPANNMTRAQVAKVVVKLLEYRAQ